MSKIEIHVAYSYSPRTKTYFAASYVRTTEMPGLPPNHAYKSDLRTGIGDSAKEATDESVSRTVLAIINRGIDSGTVPVIRHGRKSHETVKGYFFP